jgi:hypothetical protein
MPAADLAPLGSQQVSQHTRTGEGELKVQPIQMPHDREVGGRHRARYGPPRNLNATLYARKSVKLCAGALSIYEMMVLCSLVGSSRTGTSRLPSAVHKPVRPSIFMWASPDCNRAHLGRASSSDADISRSLTRWIAFGRCYPEARVWVAVTSQAFGSAFTRSVQNDIDNRQLGFRLITYMLAVAASPARRFSRLLRHPDKA